MASLNGTLPELQSAYAQLAAIGAAHGVTIAVADFGGIRTEADTNRILGYRQADYNAAVKAGSVRPDTTLQQFRPINAFGTSFHNYGAAFDVLIVGRPSNMSEYDAQKMLGQYAPSLGLRWGGLFKNADPPHFELAMTLDEVKRRYASSGGSVSAPTTPTLQNFDLPPIELTTDYAVDSDPFSTDLSFDDTGGTDLVYDETGDASSPNMLLIGGLVLVGAALLYFRQRGS